MPDLKPCPHVLCVSSGGGHWMELRRLQPAWAGARVDYVVTDPGHRAEIAEGHDDARVFVVADANAGQKMRLLLLALMLIWVMIRVRPDVVLSTGAAPGLVAVVLGRLTGARTVWLDSIANAEKLSLSGRLSRRFSDLWMTQWPHLATTTGATYAGAVL